MTPLERTPEGALTHGCGRALFEQLRDGHTAAAECFECGAPTHPLPVALHGEPEALCPACSRAETLRRQDEQVREARRTARRQTFPHRLTMSGLAGQQQIVSALAITEEAPGGYLDTAHARGLVSAAAVSRYLATREPGLLVLSGKSGSGKSTASAWGAWSTDGVFYARPNWSALPSYGQVPPDDLAMMLGVRGALVLDDVCRVRGGGQPGDTNGQAELVFQVAAGRHEARLPTILTTQATSSDLELAYGSSGQALLRRAEDGLGPDGAPLTGGFIDCSPTQRGRP